jgi:diguanylate cyclase
MGYFVKSAIMTLSNSIDMVRETKSNHGEENFNLEEMFAEQKRLKYVNEVLSGGMEKILEQEQSARRVNETLQKEIVEMQEQAEHDHLTGLLNRRGFEKVIEGIREKGVTGTLVMLDVDKFKDINDKLGHNKGDEVLAAVAKALGDYMNEHARRTDLVCRWGGEEMLIFFPGATEEEVYKKFFNKDLDKAVIEIPFDLERATPEENKVTFSGGITALSLEENLEKATNRADQTLYLAKQSGRNNLQIHVPDEIGPKELPQAA